MNPDGEAVTVGEGRYDRSLEAMAHDLAMPVTLRCRSEGRPGMVFEVEGKLTCTTWHGAGRTWRTPWAFSTFSRLVVTADEAPTSALFKALRLGELYRSIGAHYRDAKRTDSSMWGEASALPTPGRRGYNDGHYARWVEWYLGAVENHGRGFMKHLLADHPGWKRSTVLSTIDRAEERGLITDRPGQGRAGGRMTDKCRAILSAAETTGANS